MDLGLEKNISKVILYPRVYDCSGDVVAGFPKSFQIQKSLNATEWETISNQTYTDYLHPQIDSGEEFIFNKSVLAKYIRIFVTAPTGDAPFGSGGLH